VYNGEGLRSATGSFGFFSPGKRDFSDWKQGHVQITRGSPTAAKGKTLTGFATPSCFLRPFCVKVFTPAANDEFV
jgi:hypothetical protein